MKTVKPRGYGGILVLFVFACLLLAGSQRLIASSDTPKEIPDLSGREAWFCAAPTAAQEQLPDGQKGFARRRRKEHSCCLRTMEAAGRSHFYTMRRERQYFAGQWTLYESCISGVSLG